MTFSWTDRNVTTLKEKWAAGSSGSTIARILGTTRNAVIGKAHRLKLMKRTTISSTPKKQSMPKQAKVPKEKKVWTRGGPIAPTHIVSQNALTPTAKSLRDLGNNECRFPIGELSEPGSGFCGRANDGKTQYCEVHHKMTSTPVQGKYK